METSGGKAPQKEAVMEGTANFNIFDYFSQPVFFTVADQVLYCNAAAGRKGILLGEDLSERLSNEQEYLPQDGSNGSAQISLMIAGRPHWTTVRAHENGRLFILEPDGQKAIGADTLLPLSYTIAEAVKDLSSVTDSLLPVLEETDDLAAGHGSAAMTRSYFHLIRVSKNLTAMRSVLAGDPYILRQEADICAYLRRVCRRLAPLLDSVKLKLETSIPAEAIAVWFDERQLSRAIYNLVSNSIRYTPAGGTISIRLTKAQNRLCLSVKDNGEGFDCDVLASAFSRYARRVELDDARWGIGFGLSLVRDIAAAHGGTVVIQSAPGQGATVSMTLSTEKAPREQTVRTPMNMLDYTGGFDQALIELSDVLPVRDYYTDKK